MIKCNLNYRIQLRFGTGDINIIPGYNWEDGNRVAGVGFRNQAPRQIGIDNGDNTSDIKSITDLPVSFMFTDTKSIDVLIYALKEARSYVVEAEEVIDAIL